MEETVKNCLTFFSAKAFLMENKELKSENGDVVTQEEKQKFKVKQNADIFCFPKVVWNLMLLKAKDECFTHSRAIKNKKLRCGHEQPT